MTSSSSSSICLFDAWSKVPNIFSQMVVLMMVMNPMVQSEQKKLTKQTQGSRKFLHLKTLGFAPQITPFTTTSTWGNRFASSQAYPVILVRTPGSKPVPQYHRIANSIMSGCHSFKVSGFFCILKKPPELGVNNVPNSWAVKFHWILVDVFILGNPYNWLMK